MQSSLNKEDFTIEEIRIVEMVAGSMSDMEIAFALDLSKESVRVHFSNVTKKLGVSDRSSTIIAAIRLGLIQVDV